MAMKGWLSLVLACFSVVAISQRLMAQEAGSEVAFIARVDAVMPLAVFSGKITPVDVDPRFALTLHIDSVLPAVKELVPGETIIFGIHSPSRLFGTEPTMSRFYLFSLRHAITNDRSAFTSLRVRMTSKTDEHVADLIGMMLKADTEERAFSDLEALGCAAVPAIILRMDDRRILPDPRISLRNKSPRAFESIRHYEPRQVVDALAAILNQVTRQHFGFIYNGATDEERSKAIQGWRKFLLSTPTPDHCKAG